MTHSQYLLLHFLIVLIDVMFVDINGYMYNELLGILVFWFSANEF